MKSNTTTATAYAVSEQTAAYIGCKKELNALLESISKALMLHYGEAFENVLEADFLPAFFHLVG